MSVGGERRVSASTTCYPALTLAQVVPSRPEDRTPPAQSCRSQPAVERSVNLRRRYADVAQRVACAFAAIAVLDDQSPIEERAASTGKGRFRHAGGGTPLPHSGAIVTEAFIEREERTHLTVAKHQGGGRSAVASVDLQWRFVFGQE